MQTIAEENITRAFGSRCCTKRLLKRVDLRGLDELGWELYAGQLIDEGRLVTARKPGVETAFDQSS